MLLAKWGFLDFPNISRLHHNSDSSHRHTCIYKPLYKRQRGNMFGKTKTRKNNWQKKNTLKHSIIISSDQKIVNKLQQKVEKVTLRPRNIFPESRGGQKGLWTQLTGHFFVSQIFDLQVQKAELRLASTRDILSLLPITATHLHTVSRHNGATGEVHSRNSTLIKAHSGLRYSSKDNHNGGEACPGNPC